jgi:quercetin 2,3-dioxygenase
MTITRSVSGLVESQIASDGAGVKLRRSIGTGMISELDPFLLLDAFGTENPDDYIAGFPDHPHRGFETVTYMIKGQMRHRDSTGAEGVLGPGSVQWMTAGRGIIHSEMPEQQEGEMRGFQLWVNLPAKDKMCEPRYQNIDPDNVPEIESDSLKIRVVAGSATLDGKDQLGPVSNVSVDPLYLDIAFKQAGNYTQSVTAGQTAFVYVFEGSARIAGTVVDTHNLAILNDGDTVEIEADGPARLILVAGAPIGEPVARYGPFVMNTHSEIRQAITDFQAGKF